MVRNFMAISIEEKYGSIFSYDLENSRDILEVNKFRNLYKMGKIDILYEGICVGRAMSKTKGLENITNLIDKVDEEVLDAFVGSLFLSKSS